MKSLEEALLAMKKLIRWLSDHHGQAAKSRKEGLEVALTVHRLGLQDVLPRTFRSANPVESLFDKVECRIKRVKN